MSAQRRPASRRAASGAAGAPGGATAGTMNGPVDDALPVEDEFDVDDDAPSAGAIRAARAAERRVRVEEPVRRSVLAERFGNLGRRFDDTRAELKKITWPDKDTTRNLTIVVIGISVVLGIVLGGIDYILFQIFELMT